MIKRMFLLLIVAMIVSPVLAQEADIIPQLEGQWQLVSVEMKLIAQEDGRLLEEKTLTAQQAAKRINGLLPLNILFRQDNCIITHPGGIEGGTFRVDKPGELQYQVHPLPVQQQRVPLQQQEPPVSQVFHFSFQKPEKLTLSMPSTFYKDAISRAAVKLAYRCIYQKVIQE